MYSKSRFDEYIEWIKEQYKATGEYKKPRAAICRNAKLLKVKEMTEEEKIEYRVGRWWSRANERKVIEQYKEKKLEEIPLDNRDIVSKYREIEKIKEICKNEKLRKKEEKKNRKFNEYLEWIKEQYKSTGEYKKPRRVIKKNGKTLRAKEMTEEEKNECRLGVWWIRLSKEKRILERCKDISIEQFLRLPKSTREIIMLCSYYGIGDKYSITKRMRNCVGKNVKTNSEVRNELTKMLEDFKEKQIEKEERNND